MGRILAVRLGERQELGNGAIDTGYRIILAVNVIQADVQTTTFYGDQLFQMTGSPWGAGTVDVGSLDSIALYRKFLSRFLMHPVMWAEFESVPPNPSLASSGIYLVPAQPTPFPTVEAPLVLIGNGYDSLRGWWVKFQGNFNNTIPLFRKFPSVVGGPADYSIKGN